MLEHAGVDGLINIRVRAVVSNVWLLADRAIKRRRKPTVKSVGERLIGVSNRYFHGIAIEFDFRSEGEPL